MISLPDSDSASPLWPDGITSWIPGELAAAGVPDRLPPAAVEPDPTEAAYQRGIAEGRRLAVLDAEERIRSALAAIETAAAALSAAREKLAAQFADHLHLLAVAIARQLIQQELRTDPELVAKLVERALALIPPNFRVRVHLHPEDFDSVREWIEKRSNERQIVWVSDSAIERGSCIADSPNRVVDGRLDKALLAVLEKLQNG
jgi:flagellar assembly protein FliH